MSKSLGNVVSPDDMVARYGADATRMYSLFAAPPDRDLDWQEDGVAGVSRFLARVWRLIMEENQAGEWILSGEVREVDPEKAQLKVLHATIKKVTGDIETLSFNTAISQMMIFVNALTNTPAKPVSALRPLLLLLNPFAPHLTSELWQILAEKFPGGGGDITGQPWPDHDVTHAYNPKGEWTYQHLMSVNGKFRDKMTVALDATDAALEAAALANKKVQNAIGAQTIRKIVVVPKKLVNVVAT